MFKLILNLLLILSLSTFIVSCSNDESSPAENNLNKYTANLTYGPQSTASGTEYLFNFYAVVDDQMNSEGFQFRFDVNNDGTFEQDWSATNSYTMGVNQPGKTPVKLDVKSSDGQIVSCTDTINLVKNITLPHDLGSNQGDAVWDKSGSNKIAFTWEDQIGSGLHEVFVVDYSTGDVTQVTSGVNGECRHYPEWSADGSKIFFAYKNTISYVDVNTRKIDTLINLNVGFDCYSIACSKDGKYLYYSTGNLYRYNFESKVNEKISDFSDFPITVNNEGTKIAALGNYNLSIFDLTQLQVIKTYNTGKFEEDRVEWSPDGRYITLNYVDSTSSIRLFDLQEEKYINLKVVGLSGIKSWGYTWSADGKLLAFSGAQQGKTHTSLWCIKPDLN